MVAIGLLLIRMLCDFFKPRPRLEAEILILRHQLNVLQQRTPRRRLHLRWIDRALFIWLYRRYPRILDAMRIVRPETVLRWHRMGFVAYWRWKSRSPGGRPRIAKEVRDLIRRMSLENPFWGAPKIHGELLKLGIEVAQSTVSIYMVSRRDRPLQTWKTFLCNHMEGIASIDLFVSPTIAFEQLFAFLVLGHRRRQLLWIAVTETQRQSGLRAKSPKRFLGTAQRNISFAIRTEHLAPHSRPAYERWASGIGPPRSAQPRRRRKSGMVSCTGTMRAASLCAPQREMPEAIRPCNARAGSFN
jgi:hypothetical protein